MRNALPVILAALVIVAGCQSNPFAPSAPAQPPAPQGQQIQPAPQVQIQQDPVTSRQRAEIHAELAECIRIRDAERAARSLREHLRTSRDELVAVISKMCSFVPADRPSAGDVATELGAWLARHQLAPNLAGLAADRIPGIRAKRPTKPPAEHPG